MSSRRLPTNFFSARLDDCWVIPGAEASPRDKLQTLTFNLQPWSKHHAMVLLTMTASIVEALEKIQSFGNLEKDKALAGEEIDDIPSGDHDTRTSQDSHLETDGTMEGNSRISTPSMRLAEGKKTANSGNNGEPKLSSPAVGNPISHGQIIDLSQDMQSKGLKPGRLEDLLKGVRAYVPPPPPKPEPVCTSTNITSKQLANLCSTDL